MTIFTRSFWKYAFERALKTFAQAVVGSLVGGSAAGVAGASMKVVLISAAVAAGVSVLTSITAYTGPSQDVAPSVPAPIQPVTPPQTEVPSVQ